MAADIYLRLPEETNEQWINRSFEHSRALWELALNILYGEGVILHHSYGQESEFVNGVDGFVKWCKAQHVRAPLALLRCFGHPAAIADPYQAPIIDTLGPCNGFGCMEGVLLIFTKPTKVVLRKYKVERREGSMSFHLVEDTPSAPEVMTNEALLLALDERRMTEDWDSQPEELKRKVGSLIKTLSKLVNAESEQVHEHDR